MMLSKEECLNELEILCNYADGNPSSSGEFVGKMLQEADDTLQELIKEHFELKEKYMKLLKQWGTNDNPPLKFEDLKPGMWVWDNKRKCYGQVTSDKCCALLGTRLELWGIFEENRFFRYEVKE